MWQELFNVYDMFACLFNIISLLFIKCITIFWSKNKSLALFIFDKKLGWYVYKQITWKAKYNNYKAAVKQIFRNNLYHKI